MSAASLIARIRNHSAHVTVVGQVRRPLAGRRVDPDRPAALDTDDRKAPDVDRGDLMTLPHADRYEATSDLSGRAKRRVPPELGNAGMTTLVQLRTAVRDASHRQPLDGEVGCGRRAAWWARAVTRSVARLSLPVAATLLTSSALLNPAHAQTVSF